MADEKKLKLVKCIECGEAFYVETEKKGQFKLKCFGLT